MSLGVDFKYFNGYPGGILAPGRCFAWENSRYSMGDSGREPYMVVHNQLLAHAAAVQLVFWINFLLVGLYHADLQQTEMANFATIN